MTEFITSLINEDIDYRYSKIHKPFIIYSDTLGSKIEIPPGFVHDYESVPWIKGTSKRGGVIHDYLCRIDSVPVVTKKIAADVYLEVMKHAGTSLWRRYLKYWVVRFAPGYFHKFNVLATFEEISGVVV